MEQQTRNSKQTLLRRMLDMLLCVASSLMSCNGGEEPSIQDGGTALPPPVIRLEATVDIERSPRPLHESAVLPANAIFPG